MKILILPLLTSMPSGHHQVADALEENINYHSKDIVCKKIDLLSEWSPFVESSTVKLYLQWIRHSPATYARVYKQLAIKSKGDRSRVFYERLFMKKMEQIIAFEKPDFIICTHGFPSYFINKLKRSGRCTVPCLNVYTDFFVHEVWGKNHIDCHFVPSKAVKESLQLQAGIAENKIFYTGIPVSRQFQTKKEEPTEKSCFTIILSGGSIGLGNLFEILEEGIKSKACSFNVLCGTNEVLFNKISRMKTALAVPYPYLSSKEEMNALYNSADAIITKPGGVTVSEALKKEVPIFVLAALPGQEEMNLRFLNENGLVFQIPDDTDIAPFIDQTLRNNKKMEKYRANVRKYKEAYTLEESEALSEWVMAVIKESQAHHTEKVL